MADVFHSKQRNKKLTVTHSLIPEAKLESCNVEIFTSLQAPDQKIQEYIFRKSTKLSNVCLQKCENPLLYICAFLHVYICTCECVCLCVCAYVSVCVCLCVFLSLGSIRCNCICIYVYLCLLLYVYVCACLCVYLCTYFYA